MRRSAFLLLVPAAALAIASCGSSGDGASSDTTTSPSSSTSTTADGSTTTTKAGTPACTAATLSGELGTASPGAGQVYQPLILRNTGSEACEMRGFPGVSVLDSSGTQIGEPASREGAEGSTVVVEPGGAASAVLHTTNGPIGGPCEQESSSMKVFPPDQTEALTFAASYTVCGGFSVSTLVAGENPTTS